MIDARIYCQSSSRMDQVATDSVALIVTSPPYFNAIDYATHLHRPDENYRGRGTMNYAPFLRQLDRTWRECLRILQPGRLLAIVVGTVLDRGRHYPLPFHLVGRLEALGFEFHQDIVWHKVTGGVRRAGSVIARPYPGYYYPNILTEYILLFRKPGGDPIAAGRSLAEREDARIPIDAIFKHDTANTVWHIPPVPPRHLAHPCPFPEEIPYRLIQLYTYRGESVLDPFVGSGTTVKVARYLGRTGIGYDREPAYTALARKRATEPPGLRKCDLIARFERLPTPPVPPVSSDDARVKPGATRGDS